MEQDGAAPIDPLARSGAIAIALARVGIGIAALALTWPALSALGFERPGAAGVALARLAGGRDVALGLHALAAGGERRRLREATALGAAVDLGDAVAFAALGADPGARATALRNAPLGAVAALAGAWIYRRL